MKGSLIVIKRPKRNGLYYVEGKAITTLDSSRLIVNEDKSELWHNKMGHIGNKELKSLSDQKLLVKDDIETLDFYETYVLGKSHKASLKTNSYRTNRPLGYVHIDLWDPKKYFTFD